ncbi:hypothetical protein [Methylobacterium sp. J-092]|uniref:hypothetical protein n=1 Tax=Methylobacterium sp. J-092 TaxID=2836667 RepID=UPI001FBB4A6A|nr:hypothetical protein [Methylobacterium sp. J-092]MCJ2010443.1 hypothetical protein [Methylobacterium sp. J-092]
MTIARTDDAERPVALILDGLGYGVGFEVLGRFEANEIGDASCRLMAKAVTLTLIHVLVDERAGA